MDAVGAMRNYPLGGRKVRPGEGRRHRSRARVLALHIGPRRPPTRGLRLRLGVVACAEKGRTVCDASGIGSPLAATRPPLLCDLRVLAHEMGGYLSQVKSSQVKSSQ